MGSPITTKALIYNGGKFVPNNHAAILNKTDVYYDYHIFQDLLATSDVGFALTNPNVISGDNAWSSSTHSFKLCIIHWRSGSEPIKTDSKVKRNKVQIKTIKFNPSANTIKSIHEEGTTSAPRSNLITDKSEQVHTNSVNIGSITQKQLKQKLKDLHMKDKRKRSRKIGMVRGYHVNFYEEHYEIFSKSDDKIALTGVRHGSLYEARVFISINNSKVCLLSRASVEDSWNWHKRHSYPNFNDINALVRKDLMRGFPNAVFTPDGLCDMPESQEKENFFQE
ncbi:hypothetical protein AgCh_008271 [Apium graveolens]